MALRHERRRRLISDDAGVVGAETSGRAGAGPKKSKRSDNAYAEAAHAAQRRAISSLLPSRWLAIALLAVVCWLLVGASLALHVAAGSLGLLLPREALAALRLDAPGAIADWLASTLLVLAAGAALFVYSLRRHRVDDYYGRYRVWIWIFIACLAASLFESTGLGRLGHALCVLAADASGTRSEIVWPATLAVVVFAICLRLWFEIRKCPAAVGALVGMVACLLIAAAASHDWPLAWTDAGRPLAARGCWLAGYVFLLHTFVLYARHVQLELAGGPAARTQSKRTREAPLPKNDDEQPAPAPAKPALRLRTDLDPDPVDDASLDDAAPPSQSARSHPSGNASQADESKRHLTRAERKRLRRQARMAS